MGLGSKENAGRKNIQKIAGHHSWKAKVATQTDAEILIRKINENVGGDPNAKFLLDTYAVRKIQELEAYIQFCKTHRDRGWTFKEFLKQ